MAAILVVVKRPGSPPEIVSISNSLESMQSVVGGYIEMVPLKGFKNVDVIFNEEGRLMNLPVNVQLPYWGPIFGPLIIAGRNNRKGTSVSLTKNQAEDIAAMISTLPGPRTPKPNPRYIAPAFRKLRSNPYTSASSQWFAYEYKLSVVKHSNVLHVPNQVTWIGPFTGSPASVESGNFKLSPGDYVVFESERAPGQDRRTHVVGIFPDPGGQQVKFAKRIACTRSAKLDPRNPNPVRLFDTDSRCIATFVLGKEMACE